jgi:SagB-type dehydrogenase family enzyme
MKVGIGDKFQQETKYHRYKIINPPDWNIQPALYKTYSNNEVIILNKVKNSFNSFDKALNRRKSIRNFSDKPITKDDLSYLLWCSTGIQRMEYNFEFRTAPSAGALYPIETYLITNNIHQLAKGIYHYNIKGHSLELLRKGDFSIDIAKAALNQSMCASAACVFIWTAIFNRSKCKYSQRAYRYIYLDAGHIAQNLALATTNKNIGSCQIAALYDDEVNEIIGVDGITESAIYMSVVGNIDR